MMDMGIVEASDNSLKPYTIVESKEELQKIMNTFFCENLADNKTEPLYEQDLHYYANDRQHSHSNVKKRSPRMGSNKLWLPKIP